MKVFVAGASGAIGQPLIEELLRQGHSHAGSMDNAIMQGNPLYVGTL